MKRWLPFIIIVLVGIIAVTAGTLLVNANRVAPPSTTTQTPDAQSGAQAAHIRGAEKAAITIEEFADFQCPPCGGLSAVLHKLEQDYHGRLRILFRHFPLQNHQRARPAARAAEAAGLQGKFWEMHDMLYKNRTTWGNPTADIQALFTAYATTLGLDLARFTADLDKPETEARITADQDRGKSLGVSSTPTLFLNNQLVQPASFSEQGLRAALDAALAGTPTPAPAP